MSERKSKDRPIIIIAVLLVLIIAVIYEANQSQKNAAAPTSTPAQQPSATAQQPAAVITPTSPVALQQPSPTHTRRPAHTRTPTAAPGSNPAPATPSAPLPANMPNWLTVSFTNPNPPDNYGTGVDQQVLKAIDGARKSIDVTSFDLNIPSLIDALANAAKRGVPVRIVYDGTNGSLDLDNAVTGNKVYNALKVLKAAKVGLVDGGRSNGLMHDKMVIVDGKTLFMGSWNLSYNDSYRNNNNLLRISDPKLIANYQAKFNELFVDKRFGANAEVKVPNPQVTLDGVPVENYFSPEDKVMAKLVQAVSGAQKSVHFMIFTFTNADLSNAIQQKAKVGLDVQGVIEARGASQGAMPSLYCAKLPVKTDGNKYTMHHKVIIIDGQTVITGSFNFTNAANESNDDNVLIIHSPAVAALYEQEYQRIYGAGVVPNPEDVTCGARKDFTLPSTVQPGEDRVAGQQ